MLDRRIEWLANLCQLQPVSIQVIRVLAEREGWTPLGVLVDRLGVPAVELARLASPSSPLRDWGVVRVAVDPEPALKLNERIRRFLHADANPAEADAIALCRIQIVRKPAPVSV